MTLRPLVSRLALARDLLRLQRPIGEAAAAAGMSRYHFSRTFRAVFGQSPHQVRIEARLDRAKELLLATDRSVTEIALEVGCRSLGSFVAQFSHRVGEPPTTWRRRERAAPTPTPGCLTLMCIPHDPRSAGAPMG